MQRQTLFIILFILLLSAIGFVWLRYWNAPPATIGTGAEEAPAAPRLQELRRLKKVELDTSLFRDPFFRSLTFPVPPGGVAPGSESVPGRANPFLPF